MRLTPRPRGDAATPAAASGFASGAGVLVAGRYVMAVLGWAGTLLIVRRLSPAAWGGYSLVFSVLGIIAMVSELRLGRIVMRQMVDGASDGLEGVVSSYLTFRLVVGVLAYGVAIAAMVVGGYPSAVRWGAVVGGTVLMIAAVGTGLDVLFTARLWVRSMAVAQLLGQVVQLGLVVGLYLGGTRSIVVFIIPSVVYQLVSLAWRLRSLPPTVRLRWRVEWPQWWAWVKEAAPLSLGGAIVTIYLRIDMIMLSKLGSLRAVGQYAVGYKFSDLVAYIPAAVGGTLLATLSASWPDDPVRFAAAVRKAFVVLAMVAVGVMVEFLFFSKHAIALLYGDRYTGVSLATVGLVGGVVVAFFSGVCFTALAAVQRNRIYPIAAVVGLAVNVGLNVVLIPRWSYNGAALATLVTELGVGAVLGAGARSLAGFRPLPWRSFGRALAAGLVAGGVAATVRVGVPWALAAVASVVVYGGALALLRAGGAEVRWPPDLRWPAASPVDR